MRILQPICALLYVLQLLAITLMIIHKHAHKVYTLYYAACPWNASDINNLTYYDDVYRKCTLECPANPSRYKSYSNTTRTCVQYC